MTLTDLFTVIASIAKQSSAGTWIAASRRALLAMTISSSMFSVTALAGEGTELLDRFLTETQSMSASFRQTLISEDGFVLQESTGTFTLHRPGRFRWDYVTPYEQKIISDGEDIYIYDVELDQVTVHPQDKGLSNTPMALMQGSLQLAESFDVEELDDRDGIYRLKLNSKQTDSDFDGIIVGVDAKGLRFLQLFDRFQQKTDIVFDDLRSNIETRDEMFEFTPPDGVDVFRGG